MTLYSIIITYTLFLIKIVDTSAWNIFNSDNTKHSYIEFPPWDDISTGHGILEFDFKTNKLSDLLFANDGVTDDGETQKNELKMMLGQQGALVVSFHMGQTDDQSFKEFSIGKNWNDMQWHHVKVTRNLRQVKVSIDDFEREAISQGDSEFLHLTSNVMIGGFKNRNFGFNGCIKNVKYHSDSGIIIYPQPKQIEGEVSDGCHDNCQTSLCQNKGKCISFFSKKSDGPFKCDCTSTGYAGQYCKQREQIGYLTASQYITKKTFTLRTSRVNAIQFRFRTNAPSGLIIYYGRKTEYVIIEIHGGTLHVNMALQTDPISLKLGDGRLHNGRWHDFVLKRYGNTVIANVDTFSAKASFKYLVPLSCDSQDIEYLYIGGHPKFKKKSQENFEGCLQQVYFQDQGQEIIESQEIIKNSLSFKPSLYGIKVTGGKISPKCLVSERKIKITTTSPKPTTTVTKTTKVINDPHINGEGELKKAIPVEQQSKSPKRLSESTVAWITGGICVGSIALILTLACGFYFLRKRYSGQFSAKYKAAAAARGVYGDMAPPIDHQVVYHGNQQFQVKRPKASAIL